MYVPSAFIKGPILLLLAVVDAGIAISLAIATGMQTSYIPHPRGRCSGLDAYNDTDTTLSFYGLAGSLNETKATAEEMCEEFNWEYRLGIAAV
jgi:hypothetical protein